MTHQYLRQKTIATIGSHQLSGVPLLLRRISTAAWPRKSPENADKPDKGSLYKMLWAGGEIGMKMSDVLHLLRREGKQFCNTDLFACAKTFRECGRFQHSVELLEWMGKGTINRSKGYDTVCLDIMYNLKGMAEAEKYFASLPPAAKTLPAYGALLSYYSSAFVKLQQKRRSRCIRG